MNLTIANTGNLPLLRSKYKKYKEETYKLTILVDQLQKKLKKYHDENKVLREKLNEEQPEDDLPTFHIENHVLKENKYAANQSHLPPKGNSLHSHQSSYGAGALQGQHSNAGTENFEEDPRKKLPNCQSFQDLKKIVGGSSHNDSYHGNLANPSSNNEKENNLNQSNIGNSFNLSFKFKDSHTMDDKPQQSSSHSGFAGLGSNFSLKQPSSQINGHQQPTSSQNQTKKGLSYSFLDKDQTADELAGMESFGGKEHHERSIQDDVKQSPGSNPPGSGTSADKDRQSGEKKRMSVPKLKLEILPNYHGKFNKSINHLFNK